MDNIKYKNINKIKNGLRIVSVINPNNTKFSENKQNIDTN